LRKDLKGEALEKNTKDSDCFFGERDFLEENPPPRDEKL